MTDDEKRQAAKNVDINEYLTNRGIYEDKPAMGGKTKYSSPFASDSDPSFTVYNNTNSFFCFSTGIGGDVIDLVMALDGLNFPEAIKYLLDGKYEPFTKKVEPRDRPAKFYLSDHLARNPRVIREVHMYARSRSIHDGYECCQTRKLVDDEWVVLPALGFLHVDENLKPCGVKLRSVTGSGDSRFKAAGRQQFYVLENLIEGSFAPTVLYIVESESSANSLWHHAKENKVNCVVISFGSVSTIPKMLPYKYEDIKHRHIIIDYDGSEELFNKRKRKYEVLDGKFIKLRLSKGEDLNSMYINGSIKLLKLW
jgi:hypothetical protein